jgi:hypothetical protein
MLAWRLVVVAATTIFGSIGVLAFAQEAREPYDYSAVVRQICREYAAAQHQ